MVILRRNSSPPPPGHSVIPCLRCATFDADSPTHGVLYCGGGGDHIWAVMGHAIINVGSMIHGGFQRRPI